MAEIVVEPFASPYPEPAEDTAVEEVVEGGLTDEEVDEPLDPEDEGPVDAASLAELEGEVQQAAQLDAAFLQEGVLELLGIYLHEVRRFQLLVGRGGDLALARLRRRAGGGREAARRRAGRRRADPARRVGARRRARAPSAGRVEPAAGDLGRPQAPQPRPAAARPDPGGQHRPLARGRQVRLAARLPVLDLRLLVDPPGDHPRDRRPVAGRPHPGPHVRPDLALRRAASSRLAQELGREATVEEVATFLEIPLAKAEEIHQAAQVPVSLDTPVGEDADGSIGDFVEDPTQPPLLDVVSQSLLRDSVEEAMLGLNPRERRVVELRYGLPTAGRARWPRSATSCRSAASACARSRPRRCASCAAGRSAQAGRVPQLRGQAAHGGRNRPPGFSYSALPRSYQPLSGPPIPSQHRPIWRCSMVTTTPTTARRRSRKRIGVVAPKEFCRALWEKRRVLAGPSTPLGIQTLQLGILLTHFIRANPEALDFEDQLEQIAERRPTAAGAAAPGRQDDAARLARPPLGPPRGRHPGDPRYARSEGLVGRLDRDCHARPARPAGRCCSAGAPSRCASTLAPAGRRATARSSGPTRTPASSARSTSTATRRSSSS